MLEKIDLDVKVSKQDYKARMPQLQDHLYLLQKASWDAGLPVVIIFEGWDAAGKGSSIQKLTSRLDPRGFKLYPIREARTYEKKRPWLWRFWLKLPARGEWAIFDRSWYGRVLVERVEGFIQEPAWRRAYRDIADFERTIADDGTLICKFFLHISKAEQKQRFKKLLKDPLMAWHVEPEDWEHHAKYDQYVLAIEEMLERTETEWGPWTIVEATDRRHTRIKIFETLVNALETRLTQLNAMPVYPPPRTKKHVAPEVVQLEDQENAHQKASDTARKARKSRPRKTATAKVIEPVSGDSPPDVNASPSSLTPMEP
jgi:AMP-polyphosphate phosphotransferase